MADREERLKEQMEGLTGETLRNIIGLYSSDYEADAVAAAVKELESRIARGEESAGGFAEETPESPMAALPDHELRTIIYQKFKDYRTQALEQAKAELLQRNRDLLNGSVDGSISLRDLLLKTDAERVLDAILAINEDELENADSFEQLQAHLVKPSPSVGDEIRLDADGYETDSSCWEVFGVLGKAGERVDLSVLPWSSWISARVPNNLLLRYGAEDVAAHCLLKMTSYGFHEEAIQDQQSQTGNKDFVPSFLAPKPITFDNVVNRGLELKDEAVGREENRQIRPWVRFWARLLDGALWSVLLLLVWYSLDPYTYILANSLWRIFSVYTLLWVVMEALLLSTWGTTPGKWILKVSVRNADGGKLAFQSALRRSFFVWVLGTGCGNGLLRVLTNMISYMRLVRQGATWWDARENVSVTHGEIGHLRAVIAVVLIIALLLLTFYIPRWM